MINEIALFFLVVSTSTLAGICAMGGGMILAMSLPFFVPAAAIIPIHGVTQFASNASRLVLSFRCIYWPVVPQYILGAVTGTLLFSIFVLSLSSQLIPIFIAIYLLLTLWFTPFSRLTERFESFFIVGLLQAGLGLIVAAAGPLTVTLLLKRLSDKNAIIATASLLMGIGNIAKVLTFALLGFHFSDYWLILLVTVSAATLGSMLGTYLRDKIPNQLLLTLLKALLTVMAIFTLFRGLLSYGYL